MPKKFEFKVYISGPITGIENYKNNFKIAEKKINESNIVTAVNPTKLNKENDSWNHCMKNCIAALLECDEILFIDGWDKSKGARIEFMIATAMGIPMHRFSESLNDYLPEEYFLQEKELLLHSLGVTEIKKCKYDENKEPSSETVSKIWDIFDGMKRLINWKNKNYGDSIMNPRKMFFKGETADRIRIHLEEKTNRIINHEGKERADDLSDLIGYAAFLMIANGYTSKDIEKGMVE